MPIVRIDLSDRRTPEERHDISDGIHRALVDAVGIPEGDRFHLITVHDAADLVADKSYLAVSRDDVIYIQITLVGGRRDALKQELFRHIARNLSGLERVRSEDVCVVLTENGPSDYSWGNGQAQLLGLSIPGVGE